MYMLKLREQLGSLNPAQTQLKARAYFPHCAAVDWENSLIHTKSNGPRYAVRRLQNKQKIREQVLMSTRLLSFLSQTNVTNVAATL